MDNNEIELVGGPCGHHGPYTFYKAFKYLKNGAKRVVSLCEFFFVKLWSDSDLVCIGELQLLWVDKNSEQMLASLRLYFLPENTPEGRIDHGEDEVLAITEKVVLKLEDLLTWITVDTEWTWGKSAFWEKEVEEPQEAEPAEEKPSGLTDSTVDFSDVEKEKQIIVEDDVPKIEVEEEPSPKMGSKPAVIVLSYPRYCRYRSLMKRLEGVESRWLRHSLVVALGGFASTEKNTRVLFCRDTFDYPDLEGHELLCNHLAPKLKGRPRGKRKKRSISPGGSESNESEASVHVGTSAIAKTRLTTQGGRNGLRCNSTTSPRRSTRSTENVEERDFLNKLHAHMKSHRTPIGRVPSIGYKEIDLFQFFKRVQKLGGYDNCTASRMWKSIFDELGGHHNSTSAATIMRRHYERLLLSYERHIKGEAHKPGTASERRRLKSKTSSFSDAETSENDRSSSGKSTPISTPTATPTTPTPTDFKDFSIPDKTKSEGKPSSLRSVRVKPDRLRENQQKDKEKSVPSASVPPKPEQITCTPSLPANLTSSLPETPTNVPITTAVAPVVEMPVPEKSVSPLEGKENVEIMDQISDSNVEQTRTDTEDQEDDVIEVPYKPATPEIIDLDDEPEPADEASSLTITPSSGSMIYDVKKRKLDILKEGGLEVTAITGFPEPPKDNRPSVIQHIVPPVTKSDINNLSITVTSDSRRMPPPIRIQRSQSPKKNNIVLNSKSSSDPLSPKLSPALDVHLISNNIFPSSASVKPLHNGNANTPPKVLQSRSIYSYSERTVYGNPKDSFIPNLQHATPPQIPRHLQVRHNTSNRPLGGEVLDLTVKSPQKPIVEIMRVPNVSTLANLSTLSNNVGRSVKDLSSHQSTSSGSSSSNKHYSSKQNLQTGVPLLDARVGSNLEITLVSGNGNKRDVLKPPIVPKVSMGGNNNHHRSQKRSSSGKFVNKPHIENGRHNDYLSTNSSNNNKNPSSNAANLVIPNPNSTSTANTHNGRLDMSKLEQQNLANSTNPFLSAASPLFPGYISQLAAAASKGAPYLPVIDPIYYSAALAQAQGFYPSAAAHMYPPVPTMDHLQLYKDLMSHSPRGRYPFPLPPEASITSIGQSDNSNHMKK